MNDLELLRNLIGPHVDNVTAIDIATFEDEALTCLMLPPIPGIPLSKFRIFENLETLSFDNIIFDNHEPLNTTVSQVMPLFLNSIHTKINDFAGIPGCVLSFMHSLDLSGSNLGELSTDLFNQHLDYLTLDNCSITIIDPLFFSNFPRLKELSLKDNQITELDTETFVEQSSLLYLDLNGNRIKEIPVGFFDNMSCLECLELSNNQLKITTNIFDKLSRLRELYLPSNGIADLCFLGNLDRLELLDLSGNNIELEPGVFDGLVSIKNLKLSNCNLKSIEPGMFSKLENLEILNLSDNNLTDIIGLVEQIPRIKQLYLSGNNLKIEPGDLDCLFNIIILDLTNCNLKSIEPGMFSKLENLEILNLTDNNLTDISGLAEQFPHVRVLENYI